MRHLVFVSWDDQQGSGYCVASRSSKVSAERRFSNCTGNPIFRERLNLSSRDITLTSTAPRCYGACGRNNGSLTAWYGWSSGPWQGSVRPSPRMDLIKGGRWGNRMPGTGRLQRWTGRPPLCPPGLGLPAPGAHRSFQSQFKHCSHPPIGQPRGPPYCCCPRPALASLSQSALPSSFLP